MTAGRYAHAWSLSASLAALMRKSARPISGARADYDPLLEMVGDARFVLLGEATHGTHEFYRARSAGATTSRPACRGSSTR